jgi:hypothetical protein
MSDLCSKRLTILAAAIPVLLFTSACFLKQAGLEATEIDPYAPAEPAGPVELEEQSNSQTESAGTAAGEAQNTGSDKPVPVDAMAEASNVPKSPERKAPIEEEEKVDPTSRDYSEAFNADPGYKPAAPLQGKTRSAAPEGSENARGSGARLMIITADRINIRTSPNRRSRIVGELSKGDRVRVDINETNGWAKLTEGEFIRARHLKSAEN